jgi:hypothetical protein
MHKVKMLERPRIEDRERLETLANLVHRQEQAPLDRVFRSMRPIK